MKIKLTIYSILILSALSCTDDHIPNAPITLNKFEYFNGPVKSITETIKINQLGDYKELDRQNPSFVKALFISEDGLLLKRTELGAWSMQYIYNDLGNLIEIKSSNNDTLKYRSVIQWDENNQIRDIRKYSYESEQPTEIKKYHYSNEGKEIKITNYNVKNGSPEEGEYIIYQFDDNNHIVEKAKFLKGYNADEESFISVDHLTNDNFGNPIEVKKIFYNEFRKSPREAGTESFEYEYDKQGNWTKRIRIRSTFELLLEQTDRDIEYY